MVTLETVQDVFTHHPPEGKAQLDAYREIREAGLKLARAILLHTPVCGDQQAAIRKVREAVMTANASVALKGAV
jgi:hypothetical protein